MASSRARRAAEQPWMSPMAMVRPAMNASFLAPSGTSSSIGVEAVPWLFVVGCVGQHPQPNLPSGVQSLDADARPTVVLTQRAGLPGHLVHPCEGRPDPLQVKGEARCDHIAVVLP